MRSGPPGETISDVQLITSKMEQNGIHLNIIMFKCFKVNAVEKKNPHRKSKTRSTDLRLRLTYKCQSTSILVSLLLHADVRGYCSHVNIYCQEGTSVVLSSMTPSP